MLAATAANGIEIVWSGDTPLALIGMALLTVIVAVAFFAQQQAISLTQTIGRLFHRVFGHA